MVAYARRRIIVSFSGAAGNITAQGLRVHCVATSAGQISLGACEVAIYGLRLEEMNKLATFGKRFRPVQPNTMTVTAGDDVNGESQIFQGTIDQAWGDFQSQPDVPFHVVAYAGLLESIKTPEKNTAFKSFSGPTDVVTIMQQLAGNAGFTFENNGVSNIKLDSPYLFGSIRNMILSVAKAGKFDHVIENNTLAIWPQGKARDGGNGALVISKDTGMVASPTFTDFGILVKTEFTRAINYGSSFTVHSEILPPANRTWYTVRKEYDLQSITPKGKWFLTLGGVEDPGFAQIFLGGANQ